ncbi:MAG: LytTR family DNA-binding domain-containing protein [Saprospiraceae bacterium]
MNVQCLLIDDEPLALQLLGDYIEKTEGLSLLGAFSDPIQALQFTYTNSPDLIFLDIQMPELTGIQLLKIFQQKHPVILTTAYQQYAMDGYEHDVIDYLLKPISYDRFLVAIQKFQQRKSTALEAPVATTSKDHIFVKSEYRVLRINLSDILFLEGLGDYVAIHTAKGKILTLENMKHFAAVLPLRQFMRVHKSYIIAFSKIDFIERNRVVIKTQRIPISDTYKKDFWQQIKS